MDLGVSSGGAARSLRTLSRAPWSVSLGDPIAKPGLARAEADAARDAIFSRRLTQEPQVGPGSQCLISLSRCESCR
jgi:hypothetical protein